MRFYYENNMGDYGFFSEDNLIKAIYTAWNIEARLSLLDKGLMRINFDNLSCQMKLVFDPWEENEFNSELLKEYGYYMVDGEEEREIRQLKDDKVINYDWSEVKHLY